MSSAPSRDNQLTFREAAQSILLFSLMVIVFKHQSRLGMSIFDEGSVVGGAMLVGDGMIPYRDFSSLYGPGQYYLTAAIFYVLGETLSSARILHALLLAILGITIFSLPGQKSSKRSLVLLLVYVGIVLFAQPNVGYPAITATIFLLSGALPLLEWSRAGRMSSLLLASSLVGIAGLFRWDFGFFGLVAITSATAIAMIDERGKSTRAIPALPCLVGALTPAMLILAAVYLPLLVMFSDPNRWYEEVMIYSIREFPKWRNSEFVRPTYQGLLWALSEGSSALHVEKAVLRMAYLALPILLVVGSLGTAVRILLRKRAVHPEGGSLLLIVYLTFLCMLLLNQMRVRPTLWQGFPAMVVALPLMAILSFHYREPIARSGRVTTALGVIGFVLSAMLFNVAFQGVLESSNQKLIELDTPRSSGVYIKPEMAPYIDLVRYVRDNTRSGDAIYSGVQDHSRLVINDAMLYFLTDRRPADRFLALEPGISNTRSGQEEIIGALERNNVRLIVLGDFPSDEPNQTSESNGVTALDQFIHANYRIVRRIGGRVVMVRN